MFSRIAFVEPPTTSTDAVVAINKPNHRIFVIDCSGSMDEVIETLRLHLKNKIPTLCSAQDYVTLIWFRTDYRSGISAGIVQEHVLVGNLEAVQNLNSAIDNYIQANGGTSFTQAMRLANSVANKYTEPSQIFFMTDGDENERTSETFDEFKRCSTNLVFVEYGWHSDSGYIERLTTAARGVHIFSEDFPQFSKNIDYFLTNNVAVKSVVSFNSDKPCFALRNKELQIFAPNLEHVVMITNNASEDDVKYSSLQANEVFVYDSAKDIGAFASDAEYYISLWYSLVKINSDLTWSILKQSGDAYFIRRFSVCFSKQDYEVLISDIKDILFNGKAAFPEGIKHDLVPKEDAFTVLDLLDILSKDKECLLFYKEFLNANKYTRISKKTAEVEDEDKEITLDKAQFVPITISSHSTRANVSLDFALSTIVVCKSQKTIEQSYMYRKYTIIKDGVKHIQCLPVKLSEATFKALQENDVLPATEVYNKLRVYSLELTNLPVINRKMSNSANDYLNHPGLLLKEYVNLLKVKAERKYLNAKRKAIHLQETVAAGEEEEQSSVENSNNTSNKRTKVASEDFYMAREFVVQVDKCSSLPAINDKLIERLDAGNPTLVQSLFEEVHDAFVEKQASIKSSALTDDEKQIALAAYIDHKLEDLKEKYAQYSASVDKVKFTVLTARKWFEADVQTVAPNTITTTTTVNGQTFTGTLKIREVRVDL